MNYIALFLLAVLVAYGLMRLLRAIRPKQEDFFETHMGSLAAPVHHRHTTWKEFNADRTWRTHDEHDEDDQWGEVTDMMTTAAKLGVMDDPLYPKDTPSIDVIPTSNTGN